VIPPDRSIAVLPFKNLNPDKADAFFTTAVQYGMAANLAHMPSFKVVGPEKTAGYASKKLDYPTIGRKLGVRYLLEGSVLHDGDLAHVAIRLIDLDNLARPLTSQYDVPINEALSLQNEKLRAPETVHDPARFWPSFFPFRQEALGVWRWGWELPSPSRNMRPSLELWLAVPPSYPSLLPLLPIARVLSWKLQGELSYNSRGRTSRSLGRTTPTKVSPQSICGIQFPTPQRRRHQCNLGYVCQRHLSPGPSPHVSADLGISSIRAGQRNGPGAGTGTLSACFLR
jgi:TolB-like protein